MRRAVPAFLALGLQSCIIVAHEDAPEWIVDVDDGPPCAQIEGSRILEHIRVLASDEFEGRGPATPGEDKTVDYLVGQLKAFGLEPGNPDGTYTQAVPLVGMRARTSGSFRVDTGGAEIPLRFGDAELGNWNASAFRNKHPVRNFNGGMDEFMLFSRALTAAEVEKLYAQGRPPG